MFLVVLKGVGGLRVHLISLNQMYPEGTICYAQKQVMAVHLKLNVTCVAFVLRMHPGLGKSLHICRGKE